MKPIIQVQNLTKIFQVAERQPGFKGTLRHLFAPRYRQVRAVDGISFQMEKGEMVGYLGPNGAGKSTTLKMMTGLLVPTSGDLVVNGQVPWKDRTDYVSRIGAVFGQRTTLWWDLPVIDSLELLRSMYRVPADRFQRNLEEFTQLLEMTPFLETPVRSLSLGQRMRADLCAALLHEPELLFLDEPTIGLDVVARERIRQFIRHIHQQRQTTIILTTHDLSDVEKLCDRVIIIEHGRLLYDGGLNELVERFDTTRVLAVTFAEAYEEADLPGLPALQHDGRRATYAFDKNQRTASEIVPLLLERYRIADLEVRRPELAETIRRIYEENLLEDNEVKS
jgi:ABC-2 type transport system ATP-binding protein